MTVDEIATKLANIKKEPKSPVGCPASRTFVAPKSKKLKFVDPFEGTTDGNFIFSLWGCCMWTIHFNYLTQYKNCQAKCYMVKIKVIISCLIIYVVYN